MLSYEIQKLFSLNQRLILRLCPNQLLELRFRLFRLLNGIKVDSYDFLLEHFMKNQVLWKVVLNEFPAFVLIKLVENVVSVVSEGFWIA